MAKEKPRSPVGDMTLEKACLMHKSGIRTTLESDRRDIGDPWHNGHHAHVDARIDELAVRLFVLAETCSAAGVMTLEGYEERLAAAMNARLREIESRLAARLRL